MHIYSSFDYCTNDREVNPLVHVDLVRLLFPHSPIMLAFCDCFKSKPKLDT